MMPMLQLFSDADRTLLTSMLIDKTLSGLSDDKMRHLGVFPFHSIAGFIHNTFVFLLRVDSRGKEENLSMCW